MLIAPSSARLWTTSALAATLVTVAAACGAAGSSGRLATKKSASRSTAGVAQTTSPTSVAGRSESTAPSGGYREGSITYDQPLLDGQKVDTAAAAQALVKYQLAIPSDVIPTGVFVRPGDNDPASAAVVFTVVDATQRYVILEIPASIDEAALEERQNLGSLPGSKITASLVSLPDGKTVVAFTGNVTAGVDFLLGDAEIRIYGNLGEFTADSGSSVAGEKWLPVTSR